MITVSPENAFSQLIKSAAPLLSVGVIGADLMRLGEATAALERCGCLMLHFDVSDGRFCPLLTAGAFFVKGTRTGLYKDVHLMLEEPLPFIPEFAAAGADIITVHTESGRHVHRALQLIGEQKNANEPGRGILRGIALLPGTPLDALEPFLPEADMVFLIAINPGFPNQRFIGATADRYRRLQEMIAPLPEKPLLAIDGGVTVATIADIASLGPDLVVSGSAVFESGRIAENFARLSGLLGRNR